ncbi:helix-turn-helix transcriptional regulator [Janthinobacterium sp.]|uniref:AraC family transcriptional regulator n=1 Tax=Janthinobacterium sp. TaxID=1871054 RepID=UPI00293D1FF3|nr:helix-turn-helix transcriptional regulator [Janthinobacterium sp.]
MPEKSSQRDDYQHLPRPVGAMAKEFARGVLGDRHQHARAQLLYAVAGVLEVRTALGVWIVPPQRALWIPPRTEHQVRFQTAASVRTLYVAPEAVPAGAPPRPCAVGVSALLRELILRAVQMPLAYDENGLDGRIVALALEEIAWRADAPLHLPAFSDARLLRIHRTLLAEPGDARSLAQWAAQLHTSSRTLARLFQAECGTSFVRWRQQLRVLQALPRLAAGEAVTVVALDLGYETPGAFAAMFRSLMGAPPSRYF